MLRVGEDSKLRLRVGLPADGDGSRCDSSRLMDANVSRETDSPPSKRPELPADIVESRMKRSQQLE